MAEKTDLPRHAAGTVSPPPARPRTDDPGSHPRFVGEVTIELGDNRNRRFRWAPTQSDLDGTWRRSNLQPDEMVDQTLGMPEEIPGMRIQVDGTNRRLRIYDPLGEPEYQELARELFRKVKAHLGDTQCEREGTVIDQASETKIKTWLYWMRRLVDGTPIDVRRKTGGAQAKIISGALPTLQEIIQRLPGKIRIQHGTQSTLYSRYLEDYQVEHQDD